MATRVFFGRSWKVRLGVFAVALFLAVGVFAANDWFPKTDPMTGAKTGWFGRKMPKNTTASNWNPFPPPSPTPQLSKEYLYAGSRLLAVEDANAVAAPPADIAVWRPTGGEWWVIGQTGSAFTYAQWGTTGDIPVPADYDGDGKTDFAVWRPTTQVWWITYSGGGSTSFSYGSSGDIPIAADWDGDGKADASVARPNHTSGDMEWWGTLSGGGSMNVEFGFDDDIPGPADFDGDGKADQGVYRASNEEYYWLRSSDLVQDFADIGATISTCQAPRECIVSSDYDGDGKADPAIFLLGTRYWHIFKSTTGSVYSEQWGSAGTVPVQNDYDLDGKTDLATWDGPNYGWWAIKRSSNGTTRTESWGTNGDIPVPAFYRR